MTDAGPGAAVEAAIAAITAGQAVVVTDAADREDEGDLVFAAEHATEALLAFTVRHGSGVVCVPMTGERLDELSLPPMCADNQDPKGTAYSVSVDARHSTATGISAADRSRTIRLLSDPATGSKDLTRPGHIFPLRARPGGVLEREGHTEAAVDLVRLAGLAPVGVICEIVNDDGSMTRGAALDSFCAEHQLARVSIEELVAYQRHNVPVTSSPQVRMPTPHGPFSAMAHRVGDGAEHLTLGIGDISTDEPVPVRVHSECVTGDVFGSRRCDCGPQLDLALADLAARGRGVLVYLRGHEGRGVGLLEKMRAYGLQEHGADTVDANLLLGMPVDARDYSDAAAVLRSLGVTSVELLSNNPAKAEALRSSGVAVEAMVPIQAPVTHENQTYLRTKRDRMGHNFGRLELAPVHAAG